MNIFKNNLLTIFLVLFFSCNIEKSETQENRIVCKNIKAFYKMLLINRPALQDSLLMLIDSYNSDRKDNYILCLIQKGNNFNSPNIQIEYMPIQDVNTTINVPLDTLNIGNSTLYLYDPLFSKIESINQSRSNNLKKYISKLGIDTSILNTSYKFEGRNQATAELNFMNCKEITIIRGVESVFLPPLESTIQFIDKN